MSSCEIDAASEWNKTGFRVTAGKTYQFRASGTWRDASNKCDANGYSKWYLAPWASLRRIRSAPWFALIGTVEEQDPFVIGAEKRWLATRTGEIWCYANDVPFMYWNNHGAVTLEIEESPAQPQ